MLPSDSVRGMMVNATVRGGVPTVTTTSIECFAPDRTESTARDAGRGRLGRACHAAQDVEVHGAQAARAAIALGGAHEDMPVWGEILTDEQVDALVEYVLTATKLPDLGEAERLFLQNCSSCHGNLGEGGANPGRSGDIIAPISTAEYLATRDDATLRAIISQGQPNFGMSPFADTFGGPLNSEQVDLLVAYLRAWEDSPPVELPPDVPSVPGKDPHPQSDGIRVVFTETLRSSMWKRPWIVPLEGGPE